MDQRFKQFTGLVDNCEFNLGEKKTHCSDLIGFWEMVAYQVVQGYTPSLKINMFCALSQNYQHLFEK